MHSSFGKSKLKANSQSGLITDFEEWIEAYKEKKYKEEVLKGREGRKITLLQKIILQLRIY